MQSTDRQLQALLDEYGALLKSAIRRTCAPRLAEEMDDIEQEAKIKLWQALEGRREIRQPASYIYRVAVGTAIDALRRAKSRRVSETQPLASVETTLSSRGNPGTTFASNQILAHVDAYLNHIDAEKRTIVKLYLNGLTLAEIGELLEQPGNRVRNTIYRTMEKLREHLAQLGCEYEAD